MRFRRGLAISTGVLSAALMVSACGEDEPAAPTDRDLLEAIEGRTLSPSEVETKVDTALLLCGLDSEVLNAIWNRLEPEQFEFQDFAFDHKCPERGMQSALLDASDAATTTSTSSTSTTSTTTRRRTTTTARTTTSRRSTTTADS